MEVKDFLYCSEVCRCISRGLSQYCQSGSPCHHDIGGISVFLFLLALGYLVVMLGLLSNQYFLGLIGMLGLLNRCCYVCFPRQRISTVGVLLLFLGGVTSCWPLCRFVNHCRIRHMGGLVSLELRFLLLSFLLLLILTLRPLP